MLSILRVNLLVRKLQETSPLNGPKILFIIVGFSAFRSFKLKAHLQFVCQVDMFSEHLSGNNCFLSKEDSAQSCDAAFGPQNPSFEDEWQSYLRTENAYLVGAMHSRRSDYFSCIFKCAAKLLF